MNRPTINTKSTPKRVVRHIKVFCPCGDCHSFSFMFDKNARPFVSLLFGLSSPTYIARFVIPIIVDAFKRVLPSWFGANITIERFKRLFPLFANRNPSTSVVIIIVSSLVFTTLKHMVPSCILRCASHSVNVVRCFFSRFFPETPTTSRVA